MKKKLALTLIVISGLAAASSVSATELVNCKIWKYYGNSSNYLSPSYSLYIDDSPGPIATIEKGWESEQSFSDRLTQALKDKGCGPHTYTVRGGNPGKLQNLIGTDIPWDNVKKEVKKYQDFLAYQFPKHQGSNPAVCEGDRISQNLVTAKERMVEAFGDINDPKALSTIAQAAKKITSLVSRPSDQICNLNDDDRQSLALISTGLGKAAKGAAEKNLAEAAALLSEVAGESAEAR